AHLASGQLVPGDWLGLVARHSARIASLTLVSPRPRPELHPLGSRLMVVAGDKGPDAEHSARLRAEMPDAVSHLLRDYECLPWSDVIADRGTEIAPALLRFLDEHPLPPTLLPEGEGEVAGI